jgi:hypothetical protein
VLGPIIQPQHFWLAAPFDNVLQRPDDTGGRPSFLNREPTTSFTPRL